MFKAPFSFDGRIRRIEYFLSAVISSVFGGIAMALGVGTMFLGAASNSAGGFGFGVLIGFVVLIADAWFGLAQGVKRLHDVDKSGWFILLGLIPLINIILGLYMLFADGTVGPNQYGPDPKNRMPYQQQPSSINVTVNVGGEKTATQASQAPSSAPAEGEEVK